MIEIHKPKMEEVISSLIDSVNGYCIESSVLIGRFNDLNIRITVSSDEDEDDELLPQYECVRERYPDDDAKEGK